VNDFDNVKDLSSLIKHIDRHDEEYVQYLTYKEHKGVTNQFLLDTLDSREWSVYESGNKKKYYSHYQGFECFVCKKVHENLNLWRQGQKPLTNVASVKHYGCPKPGHFDNQGRYQIQNVHDLRSAYDSVWSRAKLVGQGFRHFYDRGLNSTEREINRFVEMHERRTTKVNDTRT